MCLGFWPNTFQFSSFVSNIIPFKVLDDNTQPGKSFLTSRAELDSFAQARCPLDVGRSKRDVGNDNLDYVAKGYHVSMTNDGVTYSEEETVLIYNETCVNCSLGDLGPTCVVKVPL